MPLPHIYIYTYMHAHMYTYIHKQMMSYDVEALCCQSHIYFIFVVENLEISPQRPTRTLKLGILSSVVKSASARTVLAAVGSTSCKKGNAAEQNAHISALRAASAHTHTHHTHGQQYLRKRRAGAKCPQLFVVCVCVCV